MYAQYESGLAEYVMRVPLRVTSVTATAVRDTPLAETVTEHVTDAAGWPEYKRARLDARPCLDELVKTNECSVS